MYCLKQYIVLVEFSCRFRHTAASVLISQGTDVVTVSKMLGHAKVSTTEDIYSHVIEESKQQASNALAEVYFRRKVAEN